MHTPPFSIKEAITYGWRQTEKKLGFFVPILFAFFVLNLGLSALVEAARESTALGYVLFNIISFIFQALVGMGLLSVSLEIYGGGKASFRHLFRQTHLLLIYMAASALYSLIVFSGLVLLVIPGIIWLVRFHFYSYFIVERGYKPVQALKESLRITRGHGWRLFLFLLAVTGINLLGMIPLGLGLLLTVPTSMMAAVYVYKKLSGHDGSSSRISKD